MAYDGVQAQPHQQCRARAAAALLEDSVARAPVDAAVQGSSGGAVEVRDIPLAKVSMIVDH